MLVAIPFLKYTTLPAARFAGKIVIDAMNYFRQRDGAIEEIGFAAWDTGSLHEGGRQQEPESPLFNVPMTLAEARQRVTDAR